MGQRTVACPAFRGAVSERRRDVGIAPYAGKMYAALRIGHDPQIVPDKPNQISSKMGQGAVLCPTLHHLAASGFGTVKIQSETEKSKTSHFVLNSLGVSGPYTNLVFESTK